MHILENIRPIPFENGNSLEAGKWLVEDNNAAEIMMRAGAGACRVSPWQTDAQPWYQHVEGKNWLVTIVRPARYGDLILLTPCLRAMKAQNPGLMIRVACFPQYREVLLGLPYIDNFGIYPVPFTEEDGRYLPLEVTAENRDLETEMHITDLFAKRLGLSDFEDKKPEYRVSEMEREWVASNYPRTKKKRVAVQLRSSTPSRDYPKMGEAVKRLHERGWEIMLLGLPNELNGLGNIHGVTNCGKDRLTFRQSVAVMSTCDAFLGPDSSLIHAAGALSIPAVGVFATVPHELRTKYCPTTFVIQGKKGCDIAPCFHAPRSRSGWPQGGPCNQANKCVAMDLIEPKQVAAKVEHMAG